MKAPLFMLFQLIWTLLARWIAGLFDRDRRTGHLDRLLSLVAVRAARLTRRGTLRSGVGFSKIEPPKKSDPSAWDTDYSVNHVLAPYSIMEAAKQTSVETDGLQGELIKEPGPWLRLRGRPGRAVRQPPVGGASCGVRGRWGLRLSI